MQRTPRQSTKERAVNALVDVLCTSAQRFLAEAIELELDHFLKRFARQRGDDGLQIVVRNGYQPQRHVLTGIGPVPVRIPKIRSRGESRLVFRSALVPAYLRRARLRNTTPAPIGLYLHGIFSRDFGEALAALVGLRAVHIPQTLAREIESLWSRQWDGWFMRPLGGESWLELWADSIHLGFRNEHERECMLVAIGVNREHRSYLLAARECSGNAGQGWGELLLDLRARGLVLPREIAVGRRALGFAQAWRSVFPQAGAQLRLQSMIEDGADIEAAFDSFLDQVACPTRCPACSNTTDLCLGPGIVSRARPGKATA
jgi:putative transposase